MSLMSALRRTANRFVDRAAQGFRPALYVAAGVAILGLLTVPAMFGDMHPGEAALSIGLVAVGYGGAVLLLYGSGAVRPNESGKTPNKLLLVVLAVVLSVMLLMELGG